MSESRGEARTVNTSVRFPPELHARLVAEAARQDRSVSNLLVIYARRGLAEDEQHRASELDS